MQNSVFDVACKTNTAPAVVAFQELVDQHLGNWVELSNKIGGDVAQVAPLAIKVIHEHKALIAEAAKSKVPRKRSVEGWFGLGMGRLLSSVLIASPMLKTEMLCPYIFFIFSLPFRLPFPCSTFFWSGRNPLILRFPIF